MKKVIASFTFFGVPVQVRRSMLVGTAILTILLTAAAIWLTELTPLDALIAGILATILHWISDLLHQYGHAFAAKQVGHPMNGLRMDWVLVFSRYPKNEPELAPQIHIVRALGGPAISALVTVAALLLALVLVPMGGMAQFLATWFLALNFFIFTVGALLPPVYLPFFCNDGGAIWHWLQVQREQESRY